MTFILSDEAVNSISHIKLEDFRTNPYLVSYKYSLPVQFLVQEVSQNHLIYTRLHPKTRLRHPELADIVIAKDPLLAVYIPPPIFKLDYIIKTTANMSGCVRLHSMLCASKSWSRMFETVIQEQAHQLEALLSIQKVTPQFLYDVFLSYRLQFKDESLPLV